MEYLLPIGFCIFLILCLWVVYVMFANDIATSVLTNEKDKINDLLEPFKLKLYSLPSYRDASPCEIRWSITPGKEVGLPSRVVYRHLRKWWKKTDSYALIKLVDKCNAVEEKRTKGKFD